MNKVTVSVPYDLYGVMDRAGDGVMTNVSVTLDPDNDTWTVDGAEYKGKSERAYIESLGAPGTADWWLSKVVDQFKEFDADEMYEEIALVNGLELPEEIDKWLEAKGTSAAADKPITVVKCMTAKDMLADLAEKNK